MRSGVIALMGALICLTSCTTIHYRSSGLIAASFSPKKDHIHHTKSVGKKEFYLWGLLPKEHVVLVDEEMSKAGLISAANITIEEYQTSSDKAWSWISLGLFIPRTYKVRGFGIKTDDRL